MKEPNQWDWRRVDKLGFADFVLVDESMTLDFIKNEVARQFAAHRRHTERLCAARIAELEGALRQAAAIAVASREGAGEEVLETVKAALAGLPIPTWWRCPVCNLLIGDPEMYPSARFPCVRGAAHTWVKATT